MLFSRPKKATGIDIGTHSVKVVQMSRAGSRLRVDGAGYALVNRNQLTTDPVAAQAEAVRECLRQIPQAQSISVAALPGQTVVIRYPRMPSMPEDKLDEAIERDAGQHIPYELSDVFLDWTLLDTITQGEEKLLKILLVAAKNEEIDKRIQIADIAGVELSVLGVDSLVLADAAEGCDFLRADETVALVNIGLSSASVHFVKDGISNFIRDINWGARELINALARTRRCDHDEAERILSTAKSQVEKAEVPFPAVEPEAAPQGASLLDPFEDEVGKETHATARPGKGAEADAARKPEKPIEEILSPPLSRLVSEIRRSFEYYEHELYERPVDRLILSGGVAHVPLLCQIFADELGVKSVEVANPADSALFLGDDRAVAPLTGRPAQFMVAVGLAARGTADL